MSDTPEGTPPGEPPIDPPMTPPGDRHPVILEEEMRRSYLDYAMSVIVARALPDVRDGLKPVHRRILYACQEGGFVPGRPYRKCAKIVGAGALDPYWAWAGDASARPANAGIRASALVLLIMTFSFGAEPVCRRSRRC